MSNPDSARWSHARATLSKAFPQLYELEPGGPLALDLGAEGWLLEITPEGRLLCQYGVAMDDVMSLMSEGTPEDLGTDEVAKQAKYFIQPAVVEGPAVAAAIRVFRTNGDERGVCGRQLRATGRH